MISCAFFLISRFNVVFSTCFLPLVSCVERVVIIRVDISFFVMMNRTQKFLPTFTL